MLITMILAAAAAALTAHRRNLRRPMSVRVNRALRIAMQGVLA